jgi:hypothetical protein
MTGKNPTRTMEDVDQSVLNFAEVKAIATGNPAIIRKVELEAELNRLKVLEQQHFNSKYSLEDKLINTYPKRIASLQGSLKHLEIDMRIDKPSEEFSMRIGKKIFTDRAEAGDILIKVINAGKYTGQVIGELNGFQIIANERVSLFNPPEISLKRSGIYNVQLSESTHGSIIRMENRIKSLAEDYADTRQKISDTYTLIESAKEQSKVPFLYESELKEVSTEFEQLKAELEIGKEDISAGLLNDNDSEAVNEVMEELPDMEVDDMDLEI